MTSYTVPFTTYANIAVSVEVPDNVTDPDEIAGLAMHQISASLCNQCSSSRRNDSLELGDDWTPVPISDADPRATVTKDG